jgi:hypothetical protein
MCEDEKTAIEEAVGACSLVWPQDAMNWAFASRRGPEAFDAAPIELDLDPPGPGTVPS